MQTSLTMINPQQFNQKDNHSKYIFQRFDVNSLIFKAGACLKETLLQENMMLTFDVFFLQKFGIPQEFWKN